MTAPALSSIDALVLALQGVGYFADRRLATAVFLALKLQRPLLLEGEPGVDSQLVRLGGAIALFGFGDINATLQQIAQLTASGCDIVRVACPRQEDADALPEIARKANIPVIADIHFQPKYIFAAIDAGCAAVRVNPGNIKEFDGRVKEVAQAAGAAGIPIRIGVNAGSLDGTKGSTACSRCEAVEALPCTMGCT